MGLLRNLLHKKSAESSGRARTANEHEHYVLKCEALEHYVLKCLECDFTHHIPRDTDGNAMTFSVDTNAVKIQCVYGGMFTVTLGLKGFFSVKPTPESGAVLYSSIVDNMKVLNAHILSHVDPVFLLVRQTPQQTDHEYAKKPHGSTYARVSKERGVDVVGNIDISKAEIPGVSW